MPKGKGNFGKIFLFAAWFGATSTAGYFFWQSLSGSSTSEMSIAQLERMRGSVSYRSKNSILWRTSQIDQKFNAGDVISTSNSSAATIETTQGHLIELDANTMIRLEADTKVKSVSSEQYELRLMKGTVVARPQQRPKSTQSLLAKVAPREAKKLIIASGSNIVSLSDKPDAVLGLKSSSEKSTAEVFLSLGKNTIATSGDAKNKVATVLPSVKGADIKIVKDQPILAALKSSDTIVASEVAKLVESSTEGDGKKKKIPVVAAAPDSGQVATSGGKAPLVKNSGGFGLTGESSPAPKFDFKPKFALPKSIMSAEVLQKISTAPPIAPPVLPKLAELPKPKPKPIVKKSIKVTPAKIAAEEPKPVPQSAPKPKIVDVYPVPKVGLSGKKILVTTEILKNGCSLAPFSVNASVVVPPNTASDWEPLLRVTYEANGTTEIVDNSLPKEVGKHWTQVDMERLCNLVAGDSGAGKITFTPGYIKGSGKTMLKKSAARSVVLMSLADRTSNYTISFRPMPKAPTKHPGWLPFITSKGAGGESQLFISPQVSEKVLKTMLGKSIITSISQNANPGVLKGTYFVRDSTIVFGVSGKQLSEGETRKLAKRTGSSFGFTGVAGNFVELNGPPINRLAKLELLAKDGDSVTLVSRQRAFDLNIEDMKSSSSELLHVASSVSGAFRKKPDKIVFREAHAH